jgi:sugar O-acyltransferase (sialic acid O-acetyltransferase NeuD family)
MENPVIIFGAGSLGRSALEIFLSRDIVTYCFLDDDTSIHNTEIDEVSVMGHMKDDGFLKFIGKKCEAFVAVEEADMREEVVKMLNDRRKVMPVNAIHDKAIIASNAFLGHGNFIDAGAVISAGAHVPNHCIIHPNAVVSAQATLGEYVQVGTGSIISSGAQIGERVLIGAGVTIGPGIKVGKGAQIAPGSVVLQEVKPKKRMFGIPAQEI